MLLLSRLEFHENDPIMLHGARNLVDNWEGAKYELKRVKRVAGKDPTKEQIQIRTLGELPCSIDFSCDKFLKCNGVL